MDKATLKVQCAFGSFTDPGFISTSPPAGPLSHLVGKVTVAWSGAVLHVLSAEDVRAFAKHVHAVLAPGGVWFGVRHLQPWVLFIVLAFLSLHILAYVLVRECLLIGG